MNVYEIQTWTFDFVERNETECANFVVSMQNDALAALKSKSYSKASEMFHDIVRGMGILSAIDKDFYEPPYYAACFHLAKIEAFGLKNAKEARHYLGIARDHAEACAKHGRPTAQTAERDLEVMNAMLIEFEKGTPIPEIAEKFGIGAPYSFSGKAGSKKKKPNGKKIDIFDKLNINLSPNAKRAVLIALVAIVLLIVIICVWPSEEPQRVSQIQQEQRPEPQKQDIEAKQEMENKAYIDAANGLNVRKEPSTDGEILGKLSDGTQITVLEKKDGWVKIEYNGDEGWCSADYVKTEKAE